MPIIEVTAGGQKQRFTLGDAPLSVGRMQGNDVVIEDALASRRHCTFTLKDGIVVLKDLSSHNGTYIGPNKVSEAILSFGDVVRIGKTTMRLLPDEVDQDAPSLPTADIVLDEAQTRTVTKQAHPAVTALATKVIGTGPLTRQLAPLMQACISAPPVPGCPRSIDELGLLDRQSRPLRIDAQKQAKPAEALMAFRQLLYAAFRSRATDLHIEPKAEAYQLRFRIDGLLHSVGEISPKMGATVLNVVKVLCQADIAKKAIVQEGSFAIELPERRVDMRVSLTPSTHGQKLALRFLDKATVPDRFDELGMEPAAVAEIRRICAQDAGMVIVAGPTGSGKTTTLYTALKTIDANTRNIVTIEDPVEYRLENTTQISIDPKHELTFATVLATVMRQDPDVILVGEIRDQETAQMAMQAAMTGHLVLTTVHARDSVSTIFRLLDLGVEPFLCANAVSMTISQRLVRRLCTKCKRPFRPDARSIVALGLEGRQIEKFYAAVGCPQCMNTGYHGRLALFEMLTFTPQLRDVILTKPTIREIRAASGEWMFRTLRGSGLNKVIEGHTTVDEVERVAGADAM
ncbi:MAG: Flp pilus assembly complex ATPase component TadA [Phycisphaerae bacterium]|nr:Flp pilus assembly complex ATPase component TadA [Phycisphaerae bacterium]NUQ46394.1 Flp pilus assembly complex ATPase component TadA [Phycisphaerae bacterium]